MSYVSRLTIVAVATVAVVAASGTRAAGQTLSPAARSLSRCVQTNDHLSVVVLVDESLSLAKTDPLNQRVAGLRAALAGLARLSATTTTGRPTDVEVAVEGFYGRLDPDPGSVHWTPVTEGTVDGLIDQVGDFADKNDGLDTDYGSALIAAQDLLSKRAAELTASGGAAPCKALIWFTDGRYHISDRVDEASQGLPLTLPYAPGIRLDEEGSGKKAVEAGKEFLCRPNGLMDELANGGVVTFTVGLASGLSPADEDFLNAVTTGSAPGERCGRRLSEQTGQYLDVSDPSGLFFAFANLFGNAPVRTGATCPGELCPAGTVEFTTVEGLSSALLQASTGAEGVELHLIGPDGQVAKLSPQGPTRLTVSGAVLSQRWVSDRAVEVGAELPPDTKRWLGTWHFAFVKPTGDLPTERPRYTLQLFTDLHPATVDDSPSVVRGTRTPVRVALEDAAGHGVRGGTLADAARVSATVFDPSTGDSIAATTSPTKDGTFAVTVPVAQSSSTPVVYLDVETAFPIGADTPVAPVRRSFRLPVRLPASYPTISPSELNLPSITGVGSTSGVITVTGGRDADGCVWFGAPAIDAPGEADTVDFSLSPSAASKETCIEVASGDDRRIDVSFAPGSQATGTVRGTIPVQLASSAEARVHTVDVPVTFSLAIEPDVAKRIAIIVFLTVVGVLLPLVLLHILNLLSAHFAGASNLLALSKRVVVSPDGLRDASSAEPLTREDVRFKDFDPVGGTELRRARELELDDVHARVFASGSWRLRTASLFRGPFATAEADGRQLVVGSNSQSRLRSWVGGVVHEIPLSVAGTWIFIRTGSGGGLDAPAGGADWYDDEGDWDQESGTGEEVVGVLVLLISGGQDIDEGDRLRSAAQAGLQLHDWTVGAPTRGERDEADGPSRWDQFRNRIRGNRRDAGEVDPSPEDEVATDDDEAW